MDPMQQAPLNPSSLTCQQFPQLHMRVTGLPLSDGTNTYIACPITAASHNQGLAALNSTTAGTAASQPAIQGHQVPMQYTYQSKQQQTQQPGLNTQQASQAAVQQPFLVSQVSGIHPIRHVQQPTPQQVALQQSMPAMHVQLQCNSKQQGTVPQQIPASQQHTPSGQAAVVSPAFHVFAKCNPSLLNSMVQTLSSLGPGISAVYAALMLAGPQGMHVDDLSRFLTAYGWRHDSKALSTLCITEPAISCISPGVYTTTAYCSACHSKHAAQATIGREVAVPSGNGMKTSFMPQLLQNCVMSSTIPSSMPLEHVMLPKTAVAAAAAAADTCNLSGVQPSTTGVHTDQQHASETSSISEVRLVGQSAPTQEQPCATSTHQLETAVGNIDNLSDSPVLDSNVKADGKSSNTSTSKSAEAQQTSGLSLHTLLRSWPWPLSHEHAHLLHKVLQCMKDEVDIDYYGLKDMTVEELMAVLNEEEVDWDKVAADLEQVVDHSRLADVLGGVTTNTATVAANPSTLSVKQPVEQQGSQAEQHLDLATGNTQLGGSCIQRVNKSPASLPGPTPLQPSSIGTVATAVTRAALLQRDVQQVPDTDIGQPVSSSGLTGLSAEIQQETINADSVTPAILIQHVSAMQSAPHLQQQQQARLAPANTPHIPHHTHSWPPAAADFAAAGLLGNPQQAAGQPAQLSLTDEQLQLVQTLTAQLQAVATQQQAQGYKVPVVSCQTRKPVNPILIDLGTSQDVPPPEGELAAAHVNSALLRKDCAIVDVLHKQAEDFTENDGYCSLAAKVVTTSQHPACHTGPEGSVATETTQTQAAVPEAPPCPMQQPEEQNQQAGHVTSTAVEKVAPASRLQVSGDNHVSAHTDTCANTSGLQDGQPSIIRPATPAAITDTVHRRSHDSTSYSSGIQQLAARDGLQMLAEGECSTITQRIVHATAERQDLPKSCNTEAEVVRMVTSRHEPHPSTTAAIQVEPSAVPAAMACEVTTRCLKRPVIWIDDFVLSNKHVRKDCSKNERAEAQYEVICIDIHEEESEHGNSTQTGNCRAHVPTAGTSPQSEGRQQAVDVTLLPELQFNDKGQLTAKCRSAVCFQVTKLLEKLQLQEGITAVRKHVKKHVASIDQANKNSFTNSYEALKDALARMFAEGSCKDRREVMSALSSAFDLQL